jgi:glycosyltransferase involved in cell wall biosynthesis
MRITWSLPVPGESPESARGDVVRARNLVDGLRREGHDVRLVAAGTRAGARAAVCAYRRGVYGLLPAALARALRDVGRLGWARAHARRVAREAREQAADVIVETQVHLVPSGRLAAARAGTPLVLDDCSPPRQEAALGRGLPLSVAERSARAQAASARALVVSSHSLAEVLAGARETGGKLHVIPNGAHHAAFAPEGAAAVRRELRLEGAVVVGFVGSFQPWHRLDLLLEAVAAAPAGSRLSLLLVGDGPERGPALAAAARLGLAGRVRAPGAVPAAGVPRLLSACDIGVLPGSNGYGHPMKLVEYAVAGLPAVAPDLPPVREVPSGGLTFPPGDARGLSAALVRLAADPALRRRLGEAARVRASGWSWQARAQAFSRLLGQLRPDGTP